MCSPGATWMNEWKKSFPNFTYRIKRDVLCFIGKICKHKQTKTKTFDWFNSHQVTTLKFGERNVDWKLSFIFCALYLMNQLLCISGIFWCVSLCLPLPEIFYWKHLGRIIIPNPNVNSHSLWYW
jgi:hypothetical protein